jgi:hypothetical protein
MDTTKFALMLEELFKLLIQLGGKLVKLLLEEFSKKTNVIVNNKNILIRELYRGPEESLY